MSSGGPFPLTFTPERPDSPDAVMLIGELDAEIVRRYPGARPHGLRPGDADDPRLVFLVGRLHREAVACGAIRELDAEVTEVKRMYVRDQWRRHGVGRALLAELERRAKARGYVALRLETGTRQPEAMALYRTLGFIEIPKFGEYLASRFSVCFEKRIG